MIRLGVDTWLWTSVFSERDIPCIDRAHDAGAEMIDLSINDPFRFPVEEVADRLSRYDMQAVVTTAMSEKYNAISPDPLVREDAYVYMTRLIDIAHELGAGIVGGVTYAGSGYHTGKPRTKMEIEWCARYLEKAAEYAAQYDIDIALEPVKRFESHFLNTAEQAMELIQIVGRPNIKIHLDTFHMNIEEADIPAAIELSGDRLVHLHFVENNRDIPGRGHIPWVDIFKTLKKMNYQGAGCIETFNPETLEKTAPLTYLTRRFADTPDELASKGLVFLKAVRTMVYGSS